MSSRPPLPELNYPFGMAALLRMVAEVYRRQAGEPPDCGVWEGRWVFMLGVGVVVRGHLSPPRQPLALTVGLELPRLRPARRATETLNEEALGQFTPQQAEEMLKRLYEAVRHDQGGRCLWPPPPPPAPVPLPASGVAPGTRVRIAKKLDMLWTPHNGRRGTVVGEVDPQAVEWPPQWVRKPPKQLYLVRIERQGQGQLGPNDPWKGAAAIQTVFADYELELLKL